MGDWPLSPGGKFVVCEHRVALVSAGACGGGTGFLPVLPKNAHERGNGALRLRSRARVH